MITRTLTPVIKKSFKPGFIVIVYGPRRVGKTVLLNQLIESLKGEKTLILNGDTRETRDLLSNTSETHLAKVAENYSFIAIDEAQRVPNIALSLKIIIDKFPNKKIIATGSSSLELSAGLKETLTGRTIQFRLYPLSTREFTQELPPHEKPYLLENQLLFGGYPYLHQLGSAKEKQAYLGQLAEEYLFRDILLLKEVNYPEILRRLATLLAFQIGSEVSLNELANNLKIDTKTVSRYLYLLKQGFIIFELSAFARNLRKEVARSKKYYFWDLGIRNALISQFLPLDSRVDIGQLWENFLAVERLKKHEYSRAQVQTYFWRSYDKAEVDWMELEGGKLKAFEFKWQAQKPHTPKALKEAYRTEVGLISSENYLDFVL